jgi:hypothetical protein
VDPVTAFKNGHPFLPGTTTTTCIIRPCKILQSSNLPIPLCAHIDGCVMSQQQDKPNHHAHASSFVSSQPNAESKPPNSTLAAPDTKVEIKSQHVSAGNITESFITATSGTLIPRIAAQSVDKSKL